MNQILDGSAIIVPLAIIGFISYILYSHWRGKPTDDPITARVKDGRAFGKAFLFAAAAVLLTLMAKHYFWTHRFDQ